MDIIVGVFAVALGLAIWVWSINSGQPRPPASPTRHRAEDEEL